MFELWGIPCVPRIEFHGSHGQGLFFGHKERNFFSDNDTFFPLLLPILNHLLDVTLDGIGEQRSTHNY